MRSFSPAHTFMSAIAGNDDGLALHVTDYKSIILTIHSASSYDATLHFQASNATTKPDFTAARSATNPWYYIDAVALSGSNSDVVGGTGIVFGGTDQIGSGYEANINGAHWVNVITSARAAGSVSVTGRAYNE